MTPVKRLKITPGFWLMAAAVGLMEPELLIPTAMAAAVHELGHGAALAAVGGRAEGFVLTAAGAELALPPGLSYARELPVALGGPVASLVLALAAAGGRWFLLAGLSLALGAFNLLPLWPLDGGRAVVCLCGMYLSPTAARRVERLLAAAALGSFLALGGIALRRGFGPGLLAMGLWLGWNALNGEKSP